MPPCSFLQRTLKNTSSALLSSSGILKTTQTCIESWGRGVEKICDALKADNLPMPEYTVHPGDIMIKFTGPEDRIVRVTDKVTNGVTDNVTDRERQLLKFIIEDPGYTMLQLAEKMTVSRKTVAGYLKSLKEKGIIKRVGTTRSGHWEINETKLSVLNVVKIQSRKT